MRGSRGDERDEILQHPERLLAEKVGVARPRPQPARDEAALPVGLGEAQARAGPLRGIRRPSVVLECLVGVLLVVGGELCGEDEQRSAGKDVIRGGEGTMRLGDGNGCWDADYEEQNVLDERY